MGTMAESSGVGKRFRAAVGSTLLGLTETLQTTESQPSIRIPTRPILLPHVKESQAFQAFQTICQVQEKARTKLENISML